MSKGLISFMKRIHSRFKLLLLLLIILFIVIQWVIKDDEILPSTLLPSSPPNLKVVKNSESNKPMAGQSNAHVVQNSSAEKACDLEWLYAYQKRSAAQLANNLGDDFLVFNAQINQSINLTVYHQGEIGSGFMTRLVKQIGAVHGYYLEMLNNDATKAIDVNIIILGDRATYEDSTSQKGFDPRMSQGVFFHGSNSAFVEYKNDEITLRTAVHEAVHAINLKLLGHIPRWLNEGLAETFEHMLPSKADTDANIDHILTEHQPLELYSVISSETQWGSIDTGHLYFSGWAWVHYLLNDSQSDALRLLLTEEQQKVCEMLTAEQISQILEDAHPTIEQDFNQWRMSKQEVAN
jgi:hypothetical protein